MRIDVDLGWTYFCPIGDVSVWDILDEMNFKKATVLNFMKLRMQMEEY